MNWGDQVDSWTMGLMDGLNYVLFKNPVSSTVIDTTKYAVCNFRFEKKDNHLF